MITNKLFQKYIIIIIWIYTPLYKPTFNLHKYHRQPRLNVCDVYLCTVSIKIIIRVIFLFYLFIYVHVDGYQNLRV